MAYKIRSVLDDTFFERGFTSKTDLFLRQDLADRLTHLFTRLEHGSVSILDGRWGTGKSVFAKQWTQHMKSQGVASIYFDAFAADYIQDPFQAVSAAFVRAAADAKKTDTTTYKRFLTNAVRASRKMGIAAVKIGTKAATLGLVGASEIEQLSDLKDDIAGAASDLSEEAAKKLLEEQAQSEATFDALRRSIAELPDLLTPDQPQAEQYNENTKSLVVIIDELDRCRPDFALGVLETLKHFFRADRVHFVLVTNRDYLMKSVQKRYGLAEASGEYLQKYYDFMIHLESREGDQRFSHAAMFARRSLENLMPGTIPTQDRQDAEDALVAIGNAYNLTLREMESIITNVVLSFLAIKKNEFRPTVVICFLATVKALRPNIYSAIKRRRFDYSAFLAFTGEGEWGDYQVARIRTWFEFFGADQIKEDDPRFQNFGGAVGQYHFASRKDVLPYLANVILDRFGKI